MKLPCDYKAIIQLLQAIIDQNIEQTFELKLHTGGIPTAAATQHF